MSPQVTARKLALLKTYLQDLRSFEKTVRENHYAVERLIQLIVESMMDILLHRLASTGVVGPRHTPRWGPGRRARPDQPSWRQPAWLGECGNLLVHGYEGIDPTDGQAPPILATARFVREVGPWSFGRE